MTAAAEPDSKGNCPHGVQLQKTVKSMFLKTKVVPTGEACAACEADIKAIKAAVAAAESDLRKVCVKTRRSTRQ